MRSLFFSPCVLLFCLHLAAQEPDAFIRDFPIVPLQSKSSDVEKIAIKIEVNSLFTTYEMENLRLHVTYAKEPCIWHGWDVKTDTVISYMVYPKQMVRFEELDLASEKFTRTADHIFTQYYTDVARGIQYSVSPEGLLSYVRHTPSERDAALRCKGFPKYNAASERYTPSENFEITGNDEWDIGRLGGFLLDVKKSPRNIGTLFIYTRPRNEGEFRSLSAKFEKYAFEILKVPTNQFSVIFGGYRDRNEIEAYLLPSSYPPPMARPKYSSECCIDKK